MFARPQSAAMAAPSPRPTPGRRRDAAGTPPSRAGTRRTKPMTSGRPEPTGPGPNGHGAANPAAPPHLGGALPPPAQRNASGGDGQSRTNRVHFDSEDTLKKNQPTATDSQLPAAPPPPDPPADQRLVEAVRGGDQAAWRVLIERYEGRLLAFARSRINDWQAAEDLVQETLIGFLTSLPNYDGRRPLESYLFSICAYKITDQLRRSGRRPPLATGRRDLSSDPLASYPATARVASSIARSGERQRLEEAAVKDALAQTLQRWRANGQWTKLNCLELLFLAGHSNAQAAQQTGLSEQQVANYKSDLLQRLKSQLARAGLDSEVFPELQPDR